MKRRNLDHWALKGCIAGCMARQTKESDDRVTVHLSTCDPLSRFNYHFFYVFLLASAFPCVDRCCDTLTCMFNGGVADSLARYFDF